MVSVDKYKQLLPAAMKLAMSKPVLARRFLSQHVSHDDFMARLRKISQTDYEIQKLETLGIKYLAPVDLVSSEYFDEAFDFVLSYTVFEHVPPNEVRALLRKSITALRPGGFCIHFVDLEDHRNPENDPFCFLSADIDWKDDECVSRGNRLRFSTWRDLLAENENMDWRFPFVAIRHDADLPSEIDSVIEYIDEEDLRTTAFVTVGRRLR